MTPPLGPEHRFETRAGNYSWVVFQLTFLKCDYSLHSYFRICLLRFEFDHFYFACFVLLICLLLLCCVFTMDGLYRQSWFPEKASSRFGEILWLLLWRHHEVIVWGFEREVSTTVERLLWDVAQTVMFASGWIVITSWRKETWSHLLFKQVKAAVPQCRNTVTNKS